jgi:hypothetical protein
MEQLEAIDNQIGLLADGDRRPPVLPAVRMLAQSRVVPSSPTTTTGNGILSIFIKV